MGWWWLELGGGKGSPIRRAEKSAMKRDAAERGGMTERAAV